MHGNTYEWCRDWAHAALPGGADPDLHQAKATRNRTGDVSRIRRTSAPTLTKSMDIALTDLKLDRLVVVHPGDMEFAMAERVRAVPLAAVLKAVAPIRGTG